jgi:flagellar assembly protein FliH
MKPSSSEADAPVVAARLDRQLAAGFSGHGWAHPQIEQQIAVARRQAVEAARSEGYATGWAQGRRAAAEAADALARERDVAAARLAERAAVQFESLLAALTKAVHAADAAAVPAWDEVGDAIVEAALGIARAALVRELGSLDDATVEALRTAVRALGDPGEVTVLVHPSDAPLFAAVPPDRRPATLRIVTDPTVAPGTVAARTPAQRVAVELPAALAAAEEVLRG